jgi:replicative DNA helicase
MVADRLPPHDSEAERAVLGCVLRDNRAFADAVGVLRDSSAFYNFAHGKIFEAMGELIDESKPADCITVPAKLRESGRLDDAGGAGYVVDLWDASPAPGNAARYAEIVRGHATARQLIEVCHDLIRDAQGRVLPAEQLVSDAERRVMSLSSFGARGQYRQLADVNRAALERLDRRANGKQTGIPTGLRDLDKYTGGLHRGELVILAARPSVGKTALSLFWAYKAAQAGHAALFVSLEQEPEELAERLWCVHSGLDSARLRTGSVRIGSEDGGRILDASNYLDGLPVYIDGESRDVPGIVANCRRAKAREEIGLVVVDYLQLIDHHAPGRTMAQVVGDTTRRLKLLAKELRVPVVLLSQFSRDSEKEKRRPRLSDLRDSGCIEQDADTAILLHRGSDDDHAPRSPLQVIIAKQRNGPGAT